jgi:hypothetical protein
VRDIQAGGDLAIKFVDGAMGCGGPESAMPVVPMEPGTVPPEGTPPAEGETPAEPPTG